MTRENLEQLRYLELAIEAQIDNLRHLREKLQPHSPLISDSPIAPGTKDKIGDTVPEIVDLEASIRAEIQELQKRRYRLIQEIHQITDIRARLGIMLRYIDGLTWMDVADRIGGRETEQSISQYVYRYLKNQKEGEEERKNGNKTNVFASDNRH